jgi:hypothetical protein
VDVSSCHHLVTDGTLLHLDDYQNRGDAGCSLLVQAFMSHHLNIRMRICLNAPVCASAGAPWGSGTAPARLRRRRASPRTACLRGKIEAACPASRVPGPPASSPNITIPCLPSRLLLQGSEVQSQGCRAGVLSIARTSGRQQFQECADVSLPALPCQDSEPGGAVVAEHPAQQQREGLLEERPVVVPASASGVCRLRRRRLGVPCIVPAELQH